MALVSSTTDITQSVNQHHHLYLTINVDKTPASSQITPSQEHPDFT